MLLRFAIVIAAVWAILVHLAIWFDGDPYDGVTQVAFLLGIALIAVAYAVQWAATARR